jgi:ABC-2 type transport system ATP-binding protein
MEDAQGLCDRIGIINRGSLIAEGTLEELSQLSKSAGSTLEEIFLELTQQDESVANATARLAEAYHQSREET